MRDCGEKRGGRRRAGKTYELGVLLLHRADATWSEHWRRVFFAAAGALGAWPAAYNTRPRSARASWCWSRSESSRFAPLDVFNAELGTGKTPAYRFVGAVPPGPPVFRIGSVGLCTLPMSSAKGITDATESRRLSRSIDHVINHTPREIPALVRVRFGDKNVNEFNHGSTTLGHHVSDWRFFLYESRTSKRTCPSDGLDHRLTAPSFQIPFSMSDAYTDPFTSCTPHT